PLVQALVASLADEVQVELADRRRERIRVAETERVPVRIADVELVPKRRGRVGHEAFEQPGRVSQLELDGRRAFGPGDDRPRLRTPRADNDTAIARVRAQQEVRVCEPSRNEQLDLVHTGSSRSWRIPATGTRAHSGRCPRS